MESNLYKDEQSHSAQFHASSGQGEGGYWVGVRKTAQPHLAWLHYQVPRINHTSYSHIPAPLLLYEKLKSIRNEWKNWKEKSEYDKPL